jgi:hypothetical protein
MDIKQVKKDFDEGVMLCRSTIGKVIEHALALEAALQPADIPKAIEADWDTCTRISNIESVHEALYAFSEDATGDNGVCVVQAVLEARD